MQFKNEKLNLEILAEEAAEVIQIKSKAIRFGLDDLHQNPWLLGCRNGVIDLKKGICRPGRPDDFIRTVCPVKWDESATCPTWEKFLSDTHEDRHPTYTGPPFVTGRNL